MKQPGFFDVDERLARLSGLGDQLEAFSRTVDFEVFRPDLDRALAYADGSKGGRPPFDPVLMFKILVIQTLNNLSDERTEYLINDRLSFMRFLGLALSDRVPDAKTVWLFRERLTEAGAIQKLFERFDATLRNAGYLPMSGQILDATLVAAPKQRNTNAEKVDLREGRIPQDWQDKPAKLSHKDRHARWTLKFTKAKRQEDGTLPSTDLAIPFFGYKSHISIDRKFRLIRKWKATDAAASDGARLREGLLDKTNTASSVWADTAYRSKANEDFMDKEGFVSKVHRKKPHLKPMPRHIQRSNAGKSVIRSRVEHVFADQKSQTGLFVRTVGITRATMRIGLANIVYNMRRFLFLERLNAAA
ncbi:IS5 family transposase [Komagataeibacter medellinensis]|nr:IS5 family transposase [Komagataeibacter medellinensis]BAK82470.1 transposase [Komagataeibacter medellinensis NBRC 3288]BAK82474.1 transposase [Komagataeibacter medellinensis NBRC 3288]BAK82603.1 transposase [Komagataeibacter medellinensis NBRC 3288]BAK82640.1 transposase [Komagataeibacter medellinensis NBRC 3288]BAK82916.1 transposase [Komagataeibacter medellinensis NBRC 3288]